MAAAKRQRVDEGTAETPAVAVSEGTAETPAVAVSEGTAETPAVAVSEARSAGDDFDELVGSAPGGLDDDVFGAVDPIDLEPPKESLEEAARRSFAEGLSKANAMTEDELSSHLAVLRDEAPKWGAVRRWRSNSLLMVYVSRAPRGVRAAFAASGMPVLGATLTETVNHLEKGDATARQEAGMMALACLMCLRALPIGRAFMWQHRQTVGKAFDRLHRWCAKERSALAAELRAPTHALCKRWREQPRPANQDASGEQRGVRMKVVDLITQGLSGIPHGGSPSPASFASVASPGKLTPSVTAAEIEAALFGMHHGITHEYRQHARMLRTNLGCSTNAALRNRVLSGEVSAEELAKMDSLHLLPEEVQEKRRVEELKAMQHSVVHDLVPLAASRSEERQGFGRSYGGTAPPLLVTAGRDLSFSADDAAAKEVANQAAQTLMAPPPTPFRHDGGAPSASATHELTPEVMATPAADEEDEESASLIRFLSQKV
eukprot:TRINITY_DN2403_c0_g1_i2.p1 TRINITY_DN2403_c0_g1~~TRINITY_DN2403_c0_g1_i2.p1  ORF type:complete len:511 (-),score=105.59 TRINITY_DN2403_c0_g1_i2:137-1603(-)